MNTRELQVRSPAAFAALPEAYQNDDVLYFWEVGNTLCCTPAAGQECLGSWVSEYIDGMWLEA